MSKVKRWWIAPKLIDPIDPVEPSYFYAYDLPGDPKRLEIEVIEASYHDAKVEELQARIDRLEKVLYVFADMAPASAGLEVIIRYAKQALEESEVKQ